MSKSYLQSLDAALQQLSSIRNGAVKVPELLAAISNDRTQQAALAVVVQEMATSLSDLTSNWAHVTEVVQKAYLPSLERQQQADAQGAASQGLHGSAAHNDEVMEHVGTFEEVVTSHLISAAATEVKERCMHSTHCQQDWASHEVLAQATAATVESSQQQRQQAAVSPESPGTSVAELAAIIERVRKAVPGIVLVLCNSRGTVNVPPKDASEIKLAFPQVFCATIALSRPGQAELLRVLVDSWDKGHEMDAWGYGSHQVFRRVSSLAMRAFSYFQKRTGCWQPQHAVSTREAASQQGGSSTMHTEDQARHGSITGEQGAVASAPADVAAVEAQLQPDGRGCSSGKRHQKLQPEESLQGIVLEDMLLWLSTYRDLFTRPCCVTGKLLAWDPSTQYPLPPIYRNFKCSRHQLLRMASDPNSIRAYHMHVVPHEMLEWCIN